MPTRYNGTPEEVLALNTLIKLNRKRERVDGALIPLIKRTSASQRVSLRSSRRYIISDRFPGPALSEDPPAAAATSTTVVDNLGAKCRVRREGTKTIAEFRS